ncbi:hypothetical protein CLU82_4177 [Flavobacterium sp. 5]|nr:hypothetical protein CLU82_4177 [Flavobacterium sp. 5]
MQISTLLLKGLLFYFNKQKSSYLLPIKISVIFFRLNAINAIFMIENSELT